MILRLSSLALGLLSASPLALALSPADIAPDTPVAQLIKDATARLASGDTQEALTYFDVAISRDPKNYLTFFRRGAAYLSLGRTARAQDDFDRVLELKPGFEGALMQRAKIRARKADWAAAKTDYEAAGKPEEVVQLDEAQAAALLAQEAATKGDWEACITHSGVAIMVAGAAYDIRKTRATCRFEKGEVIEGISDLQHLVQMKTGNVAPYIQSSSMAFYSLGETDKGLRYIAQCLQSDPDSKKCMQLRRREKTLEKKLKKLHAFIEKRQFATASKLLIDRGEEEPGLLKEVQQDTADLVAEGHIFAAAPAGLYHSLLDLTCQAYIEMNSLKKGTPYCTESLQHTPTSLYAALHQAHTQLDASDFDAAIRTLDAAKQHHASSQPLDELLRKAHMLLKRSKTKDYYAVLGLARDAEPRDIKRAYRRLSKVLHPDKAAAKGVPPEEAQRKMAALNEAYEVLADPELRERFDRGDDPNDSEQQQGGGHGHPFYGSPFGGQGGGQQFMFRQGGASFQFQQGFGF